MSIIHTTIDTKAIIISINGNNGFITPSPLADNALSTSHQTSTNVTKIRNDIKIPTISHKIVLIITCRQVGL